MTTGQLPPAVFLHPIVCKHCDGCGYERILILPPVFYWATRATAVIFYCLWCGGRGTGPQAPDIDDR